MKIFLTGATGMVGRNLLDVANDTFNFLAPSSRELNLLDYSSVKRYMFVNTPDVVVHAAGRVGGIQANIAKPVEFLHDNMLMGFNVVNAAREVGVPSLINLSSSCVYPKEAKNPLKESQILSGSLEPTNEGYALAKISTMKLCSYITNNTELKFKTLIPCNLFGKYDKFSEEGSHMIPAVIKKVYEASVLGVKNIDVWGDGFARREFMFAEDLVLYIKKILNEDLLARIPNELNVGFGKDYSISEYYKFVSDVVGYNGEFRNDISKPVGMQQKLMDSSLAFEHYGWQPKTSLIDGVKKTYKYFLEIK